MAAATKAKQQRNEKSSVIEWRIENLALENGMSAAQEYAMLMFACGLPWVGCPADTWPASNILLSDTP